MTVSGSIQMRAQPALALAERAAGTYLDFALCHYGIAAIVIARLVRLEVNVTLNAGRSAKVAVRLQRDVRSAKRHPAEKHKLFSFRRHVLIRL